MAERRGQTDATRVARRPKIRLSIFGITAALCLVLVGFLAWSAWNARSAQIAETRDKARNFATAVATNLERSIEAVDIVLRGVVERIAVEGLTANSDVRGLLQARASELKQVRGFVVFDRDGICRISTHDCDVSSSYDDREFFRYHRDHPDPGMHVGGVIIGKINGDPTITITRGVRDSDGHFVGVVDASLNLSFFDQFSSRFATGLGGVASIFDPDLRYISRYPSVPNIVGKQTSPAGLYGGHPSAERGDYEATPIRDGVLREYSFIRLPELGLTVAAALGRDEELIEWRRNTLSQAIGLNVVIIPFLVLAWRLDKQIEKRAMAEHAAEKARVAAETANQAKTDFLAAMSHEIRTPLTGLLGFTEVLLQTEVTPTQRHYLDLQQDAGQGLLTVINDILDFSKMEAGELVITPTVINLRQMVNSITHLFHQSATQKDLRLSVDMSPSELNWVRADGQRLRQILSNLLSNAIKFTHHGGVSVTIRGLTSPAGPQLRIDVSDTGIGIAEGMIGKLFRKFSQVDGSIAREYGGTGLGLVISRRFAQLMGGDISVTSTIGSGSTFTVLLPLEIADAPAGPFVEDGAGTPGGQIRILVAEDSSLNQMLIEALLAAPNHAVDIVDNGAEAVAAVMAQPYDVVLMDIQMPVMDGLKATARIRSLHAAAASVPIIALSANILDSEVALCKAAGMNDHLCKPIDRLAMIAMIHHYAQQHAASAPGMDVNVNEILAAPTWSDK